MRPRGGESPKQVSEACTRNRVNTSAFHAVVAKCGASSGAQTTLASAIHMEWLNMSAIAELRWTSGDAK